MPRRAQSKPDWPEVARCLGERVSSGRAHPAVLAWARARRKNEPWAVAFSGGADSLALLLWLWAHWPERRARLVALHFNHRLRGRESLAEAAFCRRVCRGLGVTLVLGQWTEAPRAASEAAARGARHEFFSREMAARRVKALWLAHQQDDIAESLLMRLARGSGAGGLAALRPVQATGDGRLHVRPLLTIKKAELVKALRAAGAVWCEDSSNRGGAYFRNRVRRSVLPAWVRAAGRDAVAGAASSRELLEEDDAALEAWAGRLGPVGRSRVVKLGGLAGVPVAVVRRVVHRWLLRVRPETDLSRQGFAVLLAAVSRGEPTRFSLGSKGFAVIRAGELKYERRR